MFRGDNEGALISLIGPWLGFASRSFPRDAIPVLRDRVSYSGEFLPHTILFHLHCFSLSVSRRWSDSGEDS